MAGTSFLNVYRFPYKVYRNYKAYRYFLYYDKNVVTDPTNWDAILSDCAVAGKKAGMVFASGWYNAGFQAITDQRHVPSLQSCFRFQNRSLCIQ